LKPLDRNRIQQIVERERKATRGPWEGPEFVSWDILLEAAAMNDPKGSNEHVDIEILDDDWDFIAHARQDIPDLLDEVRMWRDLARGLVDNSVSDWPDGLCTCSLVKHDKGCQWGELRDAVDQMLGEDHEQDDGSLI
jgi:hypothetical protein